MDWFAHRRGGSHEWWALPLEGSRDGSELERRPAEGLGIEDLAVGVEGDEALGLAGGQLADLLEGLAAQFGTPTFGALEKHGAHAVGLLGVLHEVQLAELALVHGAGGVRHEAAGLGGLGEGDDLADVVHARQ